jgi:serine/threonine protein kinase
VVQLTKLRRILTSKNTTGVDSLKTEIVIMKKLKHKHLVKLYEVLGDQENDKIFIVTEYMKDGSLASKLEKEELAEETILKYFRQMVVGIDYCHSVANICHRDIKPENMLLDKHGDLKISDFGVSSIIENGNDCLQNTAGSNYYFSPELSKGSTYKGKASDIWALGVTLYQMVHRRYPFEGKTFPELYFNIQNSEPKYKNDLNPDLLNLLKGIL